ncbi:signal transduction histidine kinase [Chryseobacterium sp. H1D6B]|uniref:ligand-binding sensor domain-containing protein n=1 Tax=Chryseobacterium sp. H1D6B TaxID=2940588 RepID=UPI0015CACA3D|nr:ATP-binding protein [Chryseobacterium sp. H1D6B]MDH6253359.1 signal transduction histidine kinase [Chryseobacterium sp. H1D6B]
MLKNIPLLFFLFLFSNIYCQRYSTQLFNTDNGLPQNSVKDIIKDEYGFIWLTTENGIVRYDGMNFLVYKNFPLSSQRFTYFYGNPNKDSIFTTGDYGANVLIHKKSPKVIKTITKYPNIILKDNINYFLYCSNYSYTTSHDINFFMNFKKGRYYIRGNSMAYKEYHSKVTEDLKINPSYKNTPSIFAVDELLFHIDDFSKKIWKIEKGKITDSYTIPLLTDSNSSIFWSKINNQVFILNKNVLYTCIYSKGRLEVSRLAALDKIPNNLISIYYDKFYKKLYLGSSTEGLEVINFSEFTAVKRDTPKSSSVFYCTLPYDDSSVITPAGEIYNRNGFVQNKNFKNTVLYFIDYDDSGNIITSNEKQLMLYQKGSSYKHFSSIFTDKNSLKDFFFDEKSYYTLTFKPKVNGSLERSGALSIYHGKRFRSLEKKFLFNSEPTRFKKIDDSSILVGTIKGLYKISLKSNKINNYTAKNKLSIRDIIKSKDGNIWITTLGKGFYLLKNNRLLKMPYDPDENISSAHTLLEDDNGFFWIPSNNGLYKVLEEQLLMYYRNPNFKVHYYRFSKEAGFNTNEFNGGGNRAGNKLKNGEFVLPSLNGLVFFDPLKIKSYYPGFIYVERGAADGREVFFKDHLPLKQETKRVDIFIDVPYYANPSNVIIQTKLDDEQNWEIIGKDRKFTLTNPRYGNHILMIRMLISDKGKFVYKKISITIHPYFYQTLWFKIFIFSLLLLLVYFIVRWRISFLKKKNHELEEIVTLRTKNLSDTVENLEITKIKLHKEIEQQKKLIGTITHDITTPVKFISLTSKEILNSEKFDQVRTEKVLNSIYKSSYQLYNFTLTLKEYADIYSHYRSDEAVLYSLYELVEEKKVLFDEIAENNDSIIINEVDRSLSTQISKNILAVIIHNLLDNSVKYTKKGTITISSTLETENIILLITDTGSGMDEQKIEYYTKLQDNIENEKLLLQKYGMGLHLVLQLLQMIESKIIFKKNEPKGTSFTLIFKK